MIVMVMIGGGGGGDGGDEGDVDKGNSYDVSSYSSTCYGYLACLGPPSKRY